jgi:phage-related protein
MKAALALVFFACIAGSMASDARAFDLQVLFQQGHAVATALIGQLQQQIQGLVQQALGELSALVGSLGRFDLNINFQQIINQLTSQFKPLLEQLAGQALGSISAGLQGILGGRKDVLATINGALQDFLAQITGSLQGIGQHLLNQGLASVLGGLGGLGGRALWDDILATLQGHISTAVTGVQGALAGALGNLSALGSTLLDASKPHLEQLQEQLVGHGLNVLGSLSETINNLAGSITGGR